MQKERRLLGGATCGCIKHPNQNSLSLLRAAASNRLKCGGYCLWHENSARKREAPERQPLTLHPHISASAAPLTKAGIRNRNRDSPFAGLTTTTRPQPQRILEPVLLPCNRKKVPNRHASIWGWPLYWVPAASGGGAPVLSRRPALAKIGWRQRSPYPLPTGCLLPPIAHGSGSSSQRSLQKCPNSAPRKYQ